MPDSTARTATMTGAGGATAKAFSKSGYSLVLADRAEALLATFAAMLDAEVLAKGQGVIA